LPELNLIEGLNSWNPNTRKFTILNIILIVQQNNFKLFYKFINYISSSISLSDKYVTKVSFELVLSIIRISIPVQKYL
jgi:endonuclease III-like uncharacterized protein